MNVAVINARKASNSIREKNRYPLLGKVLVRYPIEAALQADTIQKVFVDTDCNQIADLAYELGCEIINRPRELCKDNINQGKIIEYDVNYIHKLHPELRQVTVLLGNAVMIYPQVIDQANEVLALDDKADSVMTVWESVDDHPYRALKINDGWLNSWENKPEDLSTNRKSYPVAYFYDQGIWCFKKETINKKEGPAPWWWMGKHVKPIIRPWIGGRNIRSFLDMAIAQYWQENRDYFIDMEQKAIEQQMPLPVTENYYF